jgi:hypothetical protein
MKPAEAKEYWKIAALSFLWCGTRFKDPDFQHQDEWRMFLSRPAGFDGVRYLGPERRRYVPWSFPEGLVTGVVKGQGCD